MSQLTPKPVVLLASSRPNGNTVALSRMAFSPDTVSVFDLARSDVGYYSYDGANDKDGFLPLLHSCIKAHTWVLATPLYWYTMSAQAKTFLDRLSDLLSGESKVLGRQLRGKHFAVLCAGTDAVPPSHLSQPLELTCAYFGMRFLGLHYCQFAERNPVAGEAAALARSFGRAILAEEANPSIERTA